MPRRPRIRRSPRREYHAGHIRQLLTGFDFRIPKPAFGMYRHGGPFRRDEAAAAWAEFREEPLAEFRTSVLSAVGVVAPRTAGTPSSHGRRSSSVRRPEGSV